MDTQLLGSNPVRSCYIVHVEILLLSHSCQIFFFVFVYLMHWVNVKLPLFTKNKDTDKKCSVVTLLLSPISEVR